MRTKIIGFSTLFFLLPIITFGQLEKKAQMSYSGSFGDYVLSDDYIDLNNDNIPDYFVQNSDAPFYYKSYGPLLYGEVITLEGKFEQNQCQLTDFDGDGDIDVIGYDKTVNQIIINTNKGNDQFEVKRIDTETNAVSHFTTVDINNDYVNDVIITAHNDNTVYIYKSNNNFKKETLLTTTKPFRISSTIDKFGPQVCINYNVTKNMKLTFDGNGNFTSKDNIIEKSGLYIYHLQDVTNDSIADLITSTQYLSYIKEGNVTGGFIAEKILGDVSFTRNFDIKDIDGDGDTDIVFPCANLYQISIMRNNGNGSFTYEKVENDMKTTTFQLINTSGLAIIDGIVYTKGLSTQPKITDIYLPNNDSFMSAFSFDYDSDGDEDLIAASYLSEYLLLFKNNGGVFVRQKRLQLNNNLTSWAVLDYNGDGRKDLVVMEYNLLQWFQNQGSGNFSDLKTIHTLPNNITGCFAAELDNDGITDLVLTAEKGNLFWIKKTSSSFDFTLKTLFNYSGAADRASRHKVIDFDNDGDNDIIAANFYAGIDLFENKGGSFTGNLKNLVPKYGSEGIGFVDLNNDGFKDLISIFSNGNYTSTISSFVNNDDNTVSKLEDITVLADGNIEFADFNNDGQLDLSIVEDNNNRVLWSLNLGNGHFSDPFVVDPKLALPVTGDVIADNHFYFQADSDPTLEAAFVIDWNLYISSFGDFAERHYTEVTNEICDQNKTPLQLEDDFKSFNLFTLDATDPIGNYDIYYAGSNWKESGEYGKNKKFNLPSGSAGNGDKTIIIENQKDKTQQTFILKDSEVCFDTSNIAEIDALMIFYVETNGQNWNNSSLFNSTKWKDLYNKYVQKKVIVASEYCSLPGIVCTNGSVTTVKIENQNLVGPLTEALSYCPNLQNVYLKYNKLKSMPASMKKFKALKNIDLFGNDIEGSISEDIGEAAELITLNFGANKLTGVLPESITHLTKLEKMLIGGGGVQVNKITGPIPENIGDMINLKEIDFSSQALTGVLPQSMGKLNKLVKLIIILTDIGGQLPDSLANINNPALTTVNLNGNRFVGCIPSSYKVFCGLSQFLIKSSKESNINSQEFCVSNKHNCEIDNDMDGFLTPIDCDDGNPAVNPNGIEVGFNNADENCDGEKLLVCQDYDGLSHNSFETAIVMCRKHKEVVTLFPDGNRNLIDNCFNTSNPYSSIWYKFRVRTNGDFYFNLVPQDTNSNLDFAVYKMTDPTDVNTLQLIRCSAATCKGQLGLTELQTDSLEMGGCDVENNNHLALINVKKDEYYAVQIIDKSNRQSDVSVQFCGSAYIGIDDATKCTEKFFTIDKDGDGYNFYSDCNDEDPNINYAQAEIPFNDIDENCDGIAKYACHKLEDFDDDFASLTTTKVICSKSDLTYKNTRWGADKISVSCDGGGLLFQSYVTVQKIKIVKGGSFYFKMKLNDPSEDLVFALYKSSNNFEKSKLQMIRCVMTGLWTSAHADVIGLSPIEADLEESGYEDGSYQNGFVKSVDANDGDEYVIYTNSFRPHLTITTSYCGTATFGLDDAECSEIYVSDEAVEFNNDIIIMPNPAHDKIMFKSDLNIQRIEILTGNGIKLNTNRENDILNIYELSSGIYSLLFHTKNGTFVKKFVKY